MNSVPILKKKKKNPYINKLKVFFVSSIRKFLNLHIPLSTVLE